MARNFETEISEFSQLFPWNTKKERASALVANGRFTTTEIAAELKIHPRTLNQWKKRRDFQVRVERHLEIWRNRVTMTGIADRARRIEALDDRWTRMKRVIEERGQSPDMQSVPGGTTGLLADDFAVDVALLREMREHELQAAKELGQLVERRDVNFKDCTWAELAREVAAEGIEAEAPLEQPPQAES